MAENFGRPLAALGGLASGRLFGRMGLKNRTLRKKLSASSAGRAGSSRRLDLGDGHDLTLLQMTHDASMTHLHIEPL